MGVVDAFAAEDRIQVKFSDFYNLVKARARVDLLTNAINARVPHKFIQQMMDGQSDLLEQYLDTGLSPEDILELDRNYTEACKELNKKRADIAKHEEMWAAKLAEEEQTATPEKQEEKQQEAEG